MDIITIDGMVENDFRHSVEDMLRLDTATLKRLMKIGDKARALLPRSKSARART